MHKFLRLLYLFVFFFSFFLSPKLTYAHFPAKDGAITVILHVDPNDAPTPGQPAHLYFLFSDTTKRFTLSTCTCTVSITEQGKQMQTQQLIDSKNRKSSIWGASMPYLFPERSVYHIVLTGNPKKADEFAPFTVSWYFRVDAITTGLVPVQQGTSDIEQLVGALAVVIIGLVLFGLFIKKM